MEQTEIQKLRSIILLSLANNPIDATEKELGYSAAMEDIIKIIDEITDNYYKNIIYSEKKRYYINSKINNFNI